MCKGREEGEGPKGDEEAEHRREGEFFCVLSERQKNEK
jgi:hypothetical protein